MQVPYMEKAIFIAKASAVRGEVPVGAVLVDNTTGNILAMSGNSVYTDNDPTAHAEINALRIACKAKGTVYLENCDIYITLEPCAMCAQAISNARIRRVYYGAYDIKSGGVEHGAKVFHSSSCHHKPEVYGGIMEEPCATIMTEFFKDKR